MPLFDAYGRMVDPATLAVETAGPSLTGIRQPFGGHPAQGLTPARLARILRAAEDGDATQYLELAEEMEEKDLHYAAVLATRKRAVAGLELTVESATDEARDVAAADLVRDFLNRDELREELFDILDAIGKAYSVTEIIWDTSKSPWLPRRLIRRDPRFFEYDRLGESLLLKTEEGPQPLTAYKYIIHRCQAKSGLNIRGGLARAAAWFYLFKNFDIKSWVKFLEVFGMPLRLGKYGQGASPEDKATLLRAVREIASDAAGIIPETMMIEFVAAAPAGGKGTDNFLIFADYLDKQMSKLVLGQTGTTDTGQYVGTSDAHREVRDDIEVADAVQLAATLNRDLVRPIVDLNFGAMELYPRIRIAREKREDLAALINNLSALVPMGLEVEMSVIRDKLGLPEPAAGAVLLTAPAVAAGMPAFNKMDPGFRRGDGELSRAGGFPRPEGKDVSRHSRESGNPSSTMPTGGEDLGGLISPAMNKVLALAGQCDSYEEFLGKMDEMLKSGGLGFEDMGEDLAGQMFLATVKGALGEV